MTVAVLFREADAEVMAHCCARLDEFGVGWAPQVSEDTKVVIAAGECVAEAAAESVLPVLAVPTVSSVEALRAASSVTATLAIGKAGAVNAALFAVAILAGSNLALREKLAAFRAEQTAAVLGARLS